LKTLYCGDPHVKPNNTQESEALSDFIIEKAIEHNVDRLHLLGDLFDTHSVVRLEVLQFWNKYFSIFAQQKFKTITLVGNHDLTGNYSNPYSALHPFLSLENKNFKIVHEPYVDGVFGYLPYIHDNNKFVEEANKLAKLGARVLISHPTYEGSVYDNGSPATGGIDYNLLDPLFLHLIGGHIHTELEYDRVWYTGNPRWLTKACANKKKGIWIVDHDDHTGQILSKEFISTASVCTPIVSVKWKEGEVKPEIPTGAKVDIELVGSSDWVTSQKKELKGVSISSKITDTKKSKLRKSGKSLFEFITEHSGLPQEQRLKLIKYMEGLNLVQN
jgi:DNA repair exonuclease SbcCD nuclease subunit